ncbi:MAG TPA: cytochrome P450 [Alphaproteobacteria bacterium]|nr:cytochrome P450 [Alphaproteobacteria bacterium]
MSRLQTALLGDLPAFVADPIRFVEEHAIGSAQPVKLRFGPTNAMLVAQPSAVRDVLVDNRDLFGKGAEQARLRPLFGEGMITASGDRWHGAREATKGSFNASGLMAGLSMALRCVATETADLAAHVGEIVPLPALMARLGTRMAAAALFHAEIDEETTEKLCDAGRITHRRLSETMWRIVDLDMLLPTPKNRKFRWAIKVFESFAESIGKEPKGVLEALAPLVSSHGKQVIRDETITMLVAGVETTATAACWLAYHLACRPDIVAWLRPEADSALANHCSMEPSVLRNMPRTRAAVQEILRLYPSAWWFARRALADTTIDGVPVKKGTSILVSPWALHRQPDLWASPFEFDPMRFFNKSPPEKFSYIPFGAGPRACIGQHLAVAELIAIAAMLVSAFELQALSGPVEQLRPFGGMSLGPPPGMAIRLHMRSQLRKVA